MLDVSTPPFAASMRWSGRGPDDTHPRPEPGAPTRPGSAQGRSASGGRPEVRASCFARKARGTRAGEEGRRGRCVDQDGTRQTAIDGGRRGRDEESAGGARSGSSRISRPTILSASTRMSASSLSRSVSVDPRKELRQRARHVGVGHSSQVGGTAFAGSDLRSLHCRSARTFGKAAGRSSHARTCREQRLRAPNRRLLVLRRHEEGDPLPFAMRSGDRRRIAPTDRRLSHVLFLF